MSVYPWNSDGTVPVRFGRYQEQFRRYLMNESDFPQNAALSVIVRETSEISHFTFRPYTDKRRMTHTHKFAMPGFAFTLMVGREIPDAFLTHCIVRGRGHPIVLGSLVEEHILRDAKKLLKRGQKARQSRLAARK